MKYVLVCILCVSQTIYAQMQETIPLSSSFYAEMDALYTIYGLGAPSAVRPWTKTQALALLDRLDPSQVPSTLLPLYEKLYGEANEQLRFSLGNSVRLDARFMLALELYAHSNTQDFVNEEDWSKGYIDRAPFTKAEFSITMGDWFYITTDLQYSWNFNADGKDEYIVPNSVGALIPDGNAEGYRIRTFADAYARAFTINIPPHTYDLECVFPKRAFVSVGGAHWNLSLGRDRLQWGNGHSGNFLIGSHRDFDDFIRFSAFYDKFRYDALYTIYDKHNYDGSGEKSRYFMLHRLEFRPFSRLVFSFSENIMYQDEYFNPQYLNPAFIYHSWDDRALFNALAHLEADFALAPRWNVYLQATLDQGRAPNESDSEADAWGILGGVEYARTLSVGRGAAVLALSLEGAYTSPELYRRDLVDFMMLNRRLSFNEGTIYSVEYIGYEYGGDALVAQFDAHLNILSKGEAGLRLFVMGHGEMNPLVSHNKDGDNTDRANIIGAAPSGSTVEKTFAVSLWGKYNIPPILSWASLVVFSQVDFIVKTDKRTYQSEPPYIQYKSGASSDLQFSLGIQLSL